MNEILKLENLSKSYQSTVALDNVNLTMEKGKIIGLLGPKKSGKTTLIKIITGMSLRYKGNVYIDNQLSSYMSKALISFLPKNLYFDNGTKIKFLKNYYKDLFSDFNQDKFEKLLERFGIPIKSSVKNLSESNKKRLKLTLVLSRDASIYIFDEFIEGILPDERQDIIDIILEFRKPNSTVIISSCNAYDIYENLFDEIVMIKQGKILYHLEAKTITNKSGKSLVESLKGGYVDVA